MPADLSSIAFFAPIAAFLLVFLVSAAILFKTEILGENRWVQIFVSLLIASIFVSAVGARELVETIVPWFAVLLVSLFLVLVLVGLVGKDAAFLHKPAGIIAAVGLGIVFIASAFVVFSDVLIGYLPGPGFGTGGSLEATIFLDWLYSPRVAGAILLVVISAAVSWVLVRVKK